MKRAVLVALLGMGGCFLVISILSNGTEEDIRNRKLQFCKGLGWISWGHAKPGGTLKAFKKFQFLNRSSTDSFAYRYAQRMKFRIGGKYLVAELAENRIVKAGLFPAAEKAAFLFIYVSVSNAFEALQARFPYRIIPASYRSSFEDGDLAGNLISYYLAVSNTSVEALKEALPLLTATQSLKEYRKNGLGKKGWSALRIDPHTPYKDLKRMEEILRAANENRDSFSRLVSQKKSLYIE